MATQRRPDRRVDVNADVAGLGYEEARDELVAVVARLEAGVGSLEESLALWERGEALAARCQQWLDGARARLSAAQPAGDGPDDADGPDRGEADGAAPGRRGEERAGGGRSGAAPDGAVSEGADDEPPDEEDET